MKLYVFKRTLILMALLMTSQVFASTIIQLSDEEIISRAAYVLKGQVSGIYTTVEKGNIPFQYITIEVGQIYKNDSDRPLYESDRIVIRQMGGTANNMTLDVDSLPKFVEGSQVLVNLKVDNNGYYYVVGNSQGLYKVVNEKLIKDTQDANTMFVRHGATGEIHFEPGQIKEINMEQMKAKIEKVTNSEEY
ncbi:MAG: hypothetical protein NTY22_04315 [Proteobacteria bacterium]|nr:hypothetical protein [Pseudomonadota bacterium]